MEKRLFFAVLLSIGLLWLWGAIVPKMFPELARKPVPKAAAPAAADRKPAAPASPAAPGATAPAAATPSVAAAPAAGAAPILGTRVVESVVDTPVFVARFSNVGAQLLSFQLKKYTMRDGVTPVDLVKARPAGRHDYPFAIQSSDGAFDRRVNSALFDVEDQQEGTTRVLTYRYRGADGVLVEKHFRVGSDYEFGFGTSLQGRDLPYRVIVGPGIANTEKGEEDSRFVMTGNGVHQTAGSLKVINREKAGALIVLDDMPEFVGLEDNYFLTAVKPKVAGAALFRRIDLPSAKKDEKPRKELYAALNSAGGRVEGSAFFGPKDVAVLEAHGLEKAVQFGMFGIIARVLLRALVWLFGVTKNYGWAIVLLTLIIKVLLYPLQHKSIVSMKKMQKLQPKVNALKDKYKKARTDVDQRQKMNAEMMKLYQQEGVNPMSGCLPMLLQLPILWAFYGLLSHAIELRGAGWIGWITDLSIKDPYYITPILMTATMFIQQWMTPTTVDPAQRKMFLIMPIVFGWIFKEFPSGLVLYWLVQNVLTIIQQMIMNRWWKEHPVEIKR